MRILGVCSYKGTNYYGWQKQVGFVSVQSTIEEVLSKVYDMPITITGSGRTDAGVHAIRQYFHFDTDKEKDLKQLAYALNKMLPEDIKIISFEKVADGFHSRYDAKRKIYEYRIVLKNKDPFQDQLAFVYPMEFDFDLFKSALDMGTEQSLQPQCPDQPRYLRRHDRHAERHHLRLDHLQCGRLPVQRQHPCAGQRGLDGNPFRAAPDHHEQPERRHPYDHGKVLSDRLG